MPSNEELLTENSLLRAQLKETLEALDAARRDITLLREELDQTIDDSLRQYDGDCEH